MVIFSIFTENSAISQVSLSKENNNPKSVNLSFQARENEKKLEYDSAVFFNKKAGNYFEKNEDWLNCVKNYRLTAKNYLVLAKYDSAAIYINKALEIAETYFNPGNKNQMFEKADVLLTLADISEKEGKFNKELSYCKRALSLAMKTDSNESIRTANIWDKTGVAYVNLEKQDSAFLFCINALKLKIKILGNKHPYIAKSYTNIGLVFDLKGEYDTALSYYHKALNIFNKAYNKDPLEAADDYHRIAIILSKKGEYDKALSYNQKALEIRISYLGENHPDIADNFNTIGIICLYKGEYDKALEFYQKALKLNVELLGEANKRSFSFYINIGIIFLAKGEYDKALEFYNKALKLYIGTFGEFHTSIAIIFNNMGLAYSYKGENDKALEYFHKAINIYIKTLGEDHPDIAMGYLYAGLVYKDKEEYDLALEYYQKALKLRINTLGENYSGISYDYNNIGEIYSAKGEYDKALEYFQKSLKIFTEAVGEQHESVISSNCAIGTVYKHKKEYEKAKDYFQKALKIYIETIGEKHPNIADIYNSIGEINNLQGGYSRALQNYQKGLIANLSDFNDTSVCSNPKLQNVLSKPILLSSFTGKAQTLFMLFKQTNKYSDLKASVSTYELAFQLINIMRNEYNIENTKLLLSENTKKNYVNAMYAAIEYDLLSNDSGKKNYVAFDFMEKGKSSTLSTIFNESQAKSLAGIPDSLLSEEMNIKNHILRLETEIDKERFYNQETDSTHLFSLEDQKFIYSRRLDSIISYFETFYPKYYKLKYSDKTVSIPTIQKSIDNQTAMLNYLVGDTILFIAIITDSLYKVESVPVDTSFKELVTGFYEDLKSAEKESFLTQSNLIYKIVIEPVKECITGKERLIIIPDDFLYYLPYETLTETVPASYYDDFSKPDYLVKNYIIQYHQSATLWYNAFTIKQQQSSDNESLVCFAPVFSKNANNSSILSSNIHNIDTTDTPYLSRSISRDGKYFNPLPHSRNEAESIVRLFKNHDKEAVAYLFNEASEFNFKTKTQSYKYIHISSHSFSNDENPGLSGIVFSQNMTDSTLDNNEDGILFTRETYNLDLNSELVVLSSCESGMGKLIRGEGLITLSRGFLYTGTPNVVYSLWKVPDKSTNHLMYSFYNYILEGNSYAQALQLAKLDMIKNEKYAFPLFWSGFIMIGR